jgi:hypothetical protein
MENHILAMLARRAAYIVRVKPTIKLTITWAGLR